MNLHVNAAARAKRDERLREYGLLGHKFEAEPARQSGRDQRSFHHREALADAASRAASERKIGVGGQARGEAVEPALWAERIGLGEIARIAMHDPLRHEHRGAGWE